MCRGFGVVPAPLFILLLALVKGDVVSSSTPGGSGLLLPIRGLVVVSSGQGLGVGAVVSTPVAGGTILLAHGADIEDVVSHGGSRFS